MKNLEILSIQEKSGEAEISLPAGYWQERYEGKIISKEILDKEKSMRLVNKTVDCALFEHMDNLKELILHDCKLEHIEGIARAQQLKTLFFVNCTFDGEDLSRLSQAPALKELSLNVMDASGLAALAGIKTLQSLSLREVTGVSLEEVTGFEKLQELSIEKMGLHDGSFLGELKNLKKLDLHRHEMDNLDFLAALTKLTEFHLAIPAANEDGLAAVQGLKKLKEFVYPVRDLGIYADLPKLETIGLAAEGVQGFEALAGSKVNSFRICGKDSPDAKEKLKKLAEEIKQYVKIYSYGQEYT